MERMKSMRFSFSKNKKDGQENDTLRQHKPPADLGMVIFRHKYLSGIEVDSPTRTPSKSHPETRKSLKGQIVTWLQDESDPITGAFYITGPACVGKTAIIETIADYCQQRGWIGATLFLSRVNRSDDNSRIISTISYQLAQKYPAFMDAIREVLRKDPLLFEKTLERQFFKLIIEPSKIFRSRISFKRLKPLVIILDGLDHCVDASSQVEFLQLIDNYIQLSGQQRCPFKWIICGRPVARWTNIISKPGNQHINLSIQDPESVEDVYKHLICVGFSDIRRQYANPFEEYEATDEEWPTKDQLEKVAEASSGFFMIASSMLQFIADEKCRDPRGQLERCLQFIDNPDQLRENNPLSPLYLVYQEILSDMRPDVLWNITRILQMLTDQPANGEFDTSHIASSLDMDLSALHQALEGLQSVLKISYQSRTLEFYHSSFANFLRYQVDPSRNKSLSFTRELLSSRSHDDDSDLALVILLQAALVDTEFDSPARYPYPRCHKSTRALLRQKLLIWFTDASREQHILWITGPLGAGKSAAAQSLAEYCHQTSRLGGSIFIPQSHNGTTINYAQRVIPTLACQLAVQFADYRALIAASLAQDPSILERDLRSQFRELIEEPLEKLQKNQHLYSPRNPLVIILDGLDACGSKNAQIELTRLIAEFAKKNSAASGLLWIICSRSESHVKQMIWRMTVQSICRHEALLIDDDESRDDVEQTLRDGFFEIRKKYFFRFGPTERWPTDIHWQIIKFSSSGFFKFAACLLQYVGDEEQRDPRALLEVCLGLVNSPLVPHTLHPFRLLDTLYEQVMLSVPSDNLPMALRILSLCVHVSSDGLLVSEILTILSIEPQTLYKALANLHSVINIISPGADDEKIGFYHHSFPAFLRDPKRSGEIARQINMDSEESTKENQPQASSSKNPGGSQNKSKVAFQSATSSTFTQPEAPVAGSSKG